MVNRLFLASVVSLAAIMVVSCAEKRTYKDSSLPIDKRVEDLLSKMTIKEKLRQLNQLDMTSLLEDGDLSQERLEELIGPDGFGSVQGITIPSWKSTALFNGLQRYCVEETRLGIPIFTSTESLHGAIQDGSTIFPQSIAVAATFNPELAYSMTRAISEELYS